MSDSNDTTLRDLLITGATFATILLPTSMFTGFFTVLLNVAAIACFVVPLVSMVRNRPPSGRPAAG